MKQMDRGVSSGGTPRPRVARAVAWLLMAACNHSASSPPLDRKGAPSNTTPELRVEAPTPAPVSARCLLAGSDAIDREEAFYWIGATYVSSLRDCRTSVLAEALDGPQLPLFSDYIGNYTSALFECPLLFTPLPGGIDAFAPSNSDVVGVPSPTLGSDDATHLIDLYLDSITDELAIGSGDLSSMRAQLEQAAAARVAPSSSGRLSTCP